jgi:IstB-like ATP binding protein
VVRYNPKGTRGSTLVTSNLPFDEWIEILGSERLTGALLDRLIPIRAASDSLGIELTRSCNEGAADCA